MTYRCFNVETTGNIAHIQLKRGDELNTMVPEFWTELPQIVRDIDDNAKARVIVISSTGKHFSAGMHLSAFPPTVPPRTLPRVRPKSAAACARMCAVVSSTSKTPSTSSTVRACRC